MTICRTRSCFPRGLLAVAVACAFAKVAVADPPTSRVYPPTYSSHKSPWYDPFGWLTSEEKKPKQSTPAPRVETPPAADLPPGAIGTPAWKWYGYGTPTPGGNPLAPAGAYAGVPGNWYTSTGATPGAIPQTQTGPGPLVDPFHPPGVVVDPAPTKWPPIVVPPAYGSGPPITPPGAGPGLPTPFATTDVDWKSSPATLRRPSTDAPATEGPRATLGMPRPADELPPAKSPGSTLAPPALRTPADAARGRNSESPDLPVSPAPDILLPPVK